MRLNTLVREGPGRTIVWLHGYTMNSRVWAPLWDRLPELRHVGVDLPGHGDSPGWRHGDGLSDVAAQVAGVCDEQGARDLVAMSFGSTIALQLMIDQPDVIDTATLAAPTIAAQAKDPIAAARMRALHTLKSCGADGEAMARLWMKSPPDIFTGLRAHGAAYRAMTRVVSSHRFDELLDNRMWCAFAATHSNAELARINATIRIVVGDADMPRFIDNATTLKRVVRRSALTRMTGCGHLPLQEDPAGAALIVREHLAVAQRQGTAG